MKFSKVGLMAVLLVGAAALVGCGKDNGPNATGVGGAHNLTPDEMRRAEINAGIFFNKEMPAGADKDGNMVLKKGAFTSCRPQDSNSNWLVTCTGMVPNKAGGFAEKTMFCGYGEGTNAILGCNDKDQR